MESVSYTHLAGLAGIHGLKAFPEFRVGQAVRNDGRYIQAVSYTHLMFSKNRIPNNIFLKCHA